MPPAPPDPTPLTRRQSDVFNFLFETVRATGRQPTIRAIAAHFGIASPNGVAFHLDALQRKGWIDTTDEGWGCKILRYPGGRPFRRFLIPMD